MNRQYLYVFTICGILCLAVQGKAAKYTEGPIYNFSESGPQFPRYGLVVDTTGNLYGVTAGNLNGKGPYDVFELSPTSNGWTETTIWSFDTDNMPASSLVVDQAGNVYGTTYGPAYSGIVYELTPPSQGVPYGTETTLATGLNSTGVVLDQAGNLYGEATQGGGTQSFVYELSLGQSGWVQTILYEFPANCCIFRGSLIRDASGNLYGVNVLNTNGSGTVFELSNTSGTWTESTLYTFTDGETGGLVMDAKGSLYTLALYGPGTVCGPGCTQVLKLTRKKGLWTATVLYSFSDNGNGFPWPGVNSPLVVDKSGNVYGTTYYGGKLGCYDSFGCGTVFKIGLHDGVWTLTNLHIFNPKLSRSQNPHDGANPYGALIFDHSGNLYGTTRFGGNTYKGQFGLFHAGCGTVFKLTLQ